MTRHALYFVSPGEVDLREEPIPEPAADQLLVRTELSAISPGTECLVYEGNVPSEMAADTALDALVPLDETDGGEAVDRDWLDRQVFAFHPHESHFCATAEELYPLPEGISAERATLLPTVETAVTLVQDGEPKLGERAVVFGQGLVGLVTTALLGQFPLESLLTVDYSADRRALSRDLGATESVHPEALGDALPLPGEASTDSQPAAGEAVGADLTYELSGNPEALDAAVSATGYDGRIVVGSWYGTKPTELDLGGRFHRSRISMTSSQVSTIDPRLRGRWDRERRMELAWQQLADCGLGELVTDRYPITEAPAAYDALAASTDGMVGTLFSYEDST
ncbi:MAG: zinc-dependent alcohol dehydrogenase [Halohasta sp.]